MVSTVASAVVTPVRTRAVIQPSALPRAMSVSGRSPTIIAGPVTKSSSNRRIGVFGFPQAIACFPVAVSIALTKAPAPG